MKYFTILPLAAFATAFIIPDEQMMSQVAIESSNAPASVFDRLPSKEQIVNDFEDTFSNLVETSKNALDEAIESVTEYSEDVHSKIHDTAFDAQSWLDSADDDFEDDGKHGKDGKHGRHGHHGHHGHCKKPNLTVYELITKSKYTTKLAALINEYEDLVELLNGTTANYTIFAPTDKAFEKVSKHAPKPSKEQLKDVLLYHVSPEFFPAGRVLVTRTIPTVYSVPETLGIGPQRLSVNIGLRGLTLNFYSRIIAINIFGTNGVIHGVDSLLIPPPKAADIIQFLPGEFSTLELGLTKTGLIEAINDTSTHIGGTLFAPSNFAFKKLGPRINGFLFSKYGQKYLKALLAYHVVANQTLYSDAYYKAEATEVEETSIPKGLFHIDLQTLLRGKSLSVDVARYGRFISIKINGFSTVSVSDGIAADGVIHVVDNVLIPPKPVDRDSVDWDYEEEMPLEEFKERLGPLIVNEEL
ncbi:hypothetical protein JMJ35_010222 [Cladonia borealis]|uniref:FAS1 domain-containing protein n=1 Tax=Cladonia borealis TaxID=184061 RepID=A0AA39QSN9_9LECA|nr:hypothetical protein JMJ35_010222 [Cladonia borealis]